MCEIFNTLISNGHNVDDLVYKYTTLQVYKYYEMCKKKEMDDMKKDAIVLYNSLLCTAQTDKKGINKQKAAWKDFMDKLDWDKMVKTSTKKPNPYRAFSALGMIRQKGKRKGY